MSSVIDATWLLNRGRSFIGQNVTGSIDFVDSDLLACLDQETLPTLSIYLPWLYDFKVDTVTDRLYPSREGIFQVRVGGERIVGVNRIREGVGAFGAFPYDPMMFGDVVDRQMVADRQSASELSLTWKFQHPNILEIFPKGIQYSELWVEMKLVHPTHLRTIPAGAREILRELFLADLATDVLGVRQYFQNLQSVFGELNLNLDRLQQQADKRTEIIEKLESKQLKHGLSQRIFIA
jgi:hypothetical protein